MSFRRIIGLFLIGAAYWVLRGRAAAMSFEVKAGNSWIGVLTDVEYLIPGLGAFLALVGGVSAALGRSGKIAALVGTGLVILFAVLVFAMSGMLNMIQPFLLPVGAMTLATLALVFTKPD